MLKILKGYHSVSMPWSKYAVDIRYKRELFSLCVTLKRVFFQIELSLLLSLNTWQNNGQIKRSSLSSPEELEWFHPNFAQPLFLCMNILLTVGLLLFSFSNPVQKSMTAFITRINSRNVIQEMTRPIDWPFDHSINYLIFFFLFLLLQL